MTEMPVTCPHCREEAMAPVDAAGQTVDCPACGKSFTIPLPAPLRSAPSPLPSAPRPASHIPLPSTAAQESVTSGMAIASMVIGILGLVGGWMCCGVILPVLAIVFGHISLGRIQKSSGRLTGKNMAIAGLTMGYVGFLVGLVISLVLGSFAAATTAAMEQLQKMLPPMK